MTLSPAQFRTLVWRHYREHGRHDLPWRKTRDVYKILVAEIMLQQTQVHRVVPIYVAFTKLFPTAKNLAQAPLSDVLKAWQGLGYNRRAKMLHVAAKEFQELHTVSYRTKQGVKNIVLTLEKLSGVGPYTARAVAAFAYNQDIVLVETNIRTAIIEHFFVKKRKVSDAQIEKVLAHVLPKGRAREWYSALMDYGAYLKQMGISHNARSKKYVKQSRFLGSFREARGIVLRTLAVHTATHARLIGLLGSQRKEQLRAALIALREEKLIKKHNRMYSLF